MENEWKMTNNPNDEPRIWNGEKGYWVQGECVFVSAISPTHAISIYRKHINEGKVKVVINDDCSEIYLYGRD
jgi:hypothetical protein